MNGPTSVGIIMDGNRRWAKAQGLPPWDGHRAGAERLKELVRWSSERDGLKHLFFYAFSTENWGREPKEVEYFISIIEDFFKKYLDEMVKENVCIKVIGQRERFSISIQKIFAEAEVLSKNNTGITVWLGLSYGGRAEIVDAVNKAVAAGQPVTEESFGKMLWTANMPDPEIIIRTGGEERLSGFLTWSSTYSELFFTKTAWPAFTKEEFFGILDEYSTRQRRMGK